LLSSQNSGSIISDDDVSAILRRMDADDDNELSFSDFFQSLLPYFIYGDIQNEKITNDLIKKNE